jgi:hypothetical protein
VVCVEVEAWPALPLTHRQLMEGGRQVNHASYDGR